MAPLTPMPRLPRELSREALLDHAEAELLVRCARPDDHPAAHRRIRELVGEVKDWNHFLDVAWEHAVVLLLYHRLDAVCPELLPAPVRERLRAHHRRTSAHSLAMTRELVEVLEALRGIGISAIPFKGPVLSATAYGDLGLRQFRDLDIVVRPPDVAAATEVLEARGYRLELSPEQRELPTRYRYQHPFVRAADNAEIELHWGFVPRAWSFPIDLDRLWSRSRVLELAGAEVRVFHPEDELLILSAHAARHFFRRLLWICDLAAYLSAHPGLDGRSLLAAAEALGCRRVLVLSLSLAHDLLGCDLPSPIAAQRLREPDLEALGEQVRRGLFDRWGPITVDDQHVFYLRLRERRRDRWRYAALRLRSLLAPSATDRAAVPLPRGLEWLHLLLRPIRLLREHSTGKLRPIRRMLAELLRR